MFATGKSNEPEDDLLDDLMNIVQNEDSSLAKNFSKNDPRFQVMTLNETIPQKILK